MGSPVADLIPQDNGLLHVMPVAAQETICHGQATVPNIYDKPINKARKALIAAGWVPQKNTQIQDNDFRVLALVKHGIPEVDACSGTGFAFCNFNYTSPAGMLSVTTIGDDTLPSVFDYAATCKK